MLWKCWKIFEMESGKETIASSFVGEWERMTMEVVAINGGFGFSRRIRTSHRNTFIFQSNKRNRDRILYDRWRHHVAEKEENEENEGARGRRNIFFVIIIILYITRIDA